MKIPKIPKKIACEVPAFVAVTFEYSSLNSLIAVPAHVNTNAWPKPPIAEANHTKINSGVLK